MWIIPFVDHEQFFFFSFFILGRLFPIIPAEHLWNDASVQGTQSNLISNLKNAIQDV